MKKRMKKIIKITIISSGSVMAIILAVFIISFYSNPYKFLYVYLGDDGSSVWAEGNPFSFRKEISGTRSPKSSDIKWSPDNNYVAFYDNVREASDMSREWFLKIFNPRTFSVRTIFIGPWVTGNYKWLDDNTVRAYAGACSGCKPYCDINIHRREPFVFGKDEDSEYCNVQTSWEYDD
jgi:hypothetical protein